LKDVSYKLSLETGGYSSSSLESLVNEAALLSVRRGGKFVKYIDLEESYLRSVLGLKGSNNQAKESLKRTALPSFVFLY